MASTTELDHVKGVWQHMQANSPIYDFLLAELRVVSATRGSVTSHLTLGPKQMNSSGAIHGAVSAAIVDMSGGLAIASHGFEKTGASVDIHVTYIGQAHVGETIEIEATANKVGRSMAFTTIRISKLADGKPGPLIATASHTKYIQNVQAQAKK
jgi:acyl-coenzyme A thioesterase 13